MPITAPGYSAPPSADIATIRSAAVPQHATAAATVLDAADPVDLVLLSPLATRHLALEPPTESLRQLGLLVQDAQQIEQVIRTPSPVSMSELAAEIGDAADALATQLPRPIDAPPKPDTHSDGQQPGAQHHEPHGPVDVLAEREQQLRDDATTMLGSAADTLARMQSRLHGNPVEEAAFVERIAASATRVAQAQARLDGIEPLPVGGRRWRGALAVALLPVLIAILDWADRTDLHVARIAAGGIVGVCILGWTWRRLPLPRRLRIELRH